MRSRRLTFSSVLVWASAAALSACGFIPGQAPTASPPISTAPATFTPTLVPTRTPGPPITLAILPADMDPALATQAEATFAELAQTAGTTFQTQPFLQPESISPDLAYLIVLTALSNAEVAIVHSRAPDARIVAFAAEGISAQPNLVLLQTPADADLQQAFLAGYTAALITEDYRVANLVGDTRDQAVADAFQSGAEYYCGLCRPQRPPFENYPLSINYAPGSGPPSAFLAGTGVQTVFLPNQLADPEISADLAGSGIVLLGTNSPLPELTQHWAASFRPSPVDAIQAGWPEITGPSPPDGLTMPITVQDVNPDLLSPGRQRLVVDTQTDLGLGLIDITASP